MRIVFVDVFATEKFKGNSAAVCFVERHSAGGDGDDELQPSYMQALAAELAQPATVFVDASSLRLRWFTPKVELPLCGHGTLAAAHAVWEAEPDRSALRFVTNTSTVTAQRTERGIEIALPAHPPRPGLVPPTLEAALGVKPVWTGFAESKLCAVLESEAQVRSLQPDLARIAALPVAGVVVTARGAAPFDFVSRYFAPSLGVPEDAVTGSAHAVLGPLWAERLGKQRFVAYQASARGGVLHLRLDGDRVAMAGAAVTVLRGELV
ncbi:MAG TPA: PhzF family phenazine biosynthesis protein [Myxococcales bacterium]|jgi:PhzF family phenazine biosynthesis protein